LGLKAPFYLPGKANSLRDRMAEWRSAQAKGHELGNHTLFHPCHGKARNRNWVPKEYNLDNYTVKRITDELKVANTLLHAIDGDTLRTFAYTCGDRTVEGQYFINKMKGVFVAARGVERGLNEPGKMDPYDLKIFGSNSRTEQGALIQQVKKAEKNGALLIFLFHGLGNERKLDTDPARHAELLNYLAKHQKTIWVAPLKEVIQYYKANQR
jgi:peptidoglycan/xylan/chitin deacetylase (PgdA/CDA1 family)